MNELIHRVLGAPELRKPHFSANVSRALGENVDSENEEPEAAADDSLPAAIDANDLPVGSAEPGTEEVGGMDDNQRVLHFLSAWESGSHMDVAQELMYSDVSYADFVRLVRSMPEQDSVELGLLLDELSNAAPGGEERGEIPGEEPGEISAAGLSKLKRNLKPAGDDSSALTP